MKFKKLCIGLLGGVALIGCGTTTTYAATATQTDGLGVYQTDQGVKFTVMNPGNQNYTGITPDEPTSGFNVFTKQNVDVGVKVTYNAETDESTYLYDYTMHVPLNASSSIALPGYKACKGYWSFDLGNNNKITKNDSFNYYVVNKSTQKEYLVSDAEKNPSIFNFYASSDFPAGAYQLKIVVSGNKTTTMNGVDIIEGLSGENAVFGENGAEGESPCRVPTSNTVYDYFYYNFVDNGSTATTAEEKLAEFKTATGINIYHDDKYAFDSYYLREDILGEDGAVGSGFNHQEHLYKHRNNCSYFLYTGQNGNYPTAYVNGIFEQGLLDQYFHSDSVVKGSIDGSEKNECNVKQYQYDYETYLKNGHTSQIEYYTLSLKYKYKVYTPKNIKELSFKGYMDQIANSMCEQINMAYDSGIRSRQELIDSLNSQINELNAQIETAATEKEALLKQIEEKNQQIETLQATIATKNDELAAKNEELAEAQNQANVLNEEIQAKEAQLAALTEADQKEIVELKKTIATLESLYFNSRSKITTLEKQKDELNIRINQYKHEVASLESDISTKQTEISNLNQSVQDLKKQVETKTSEVDTLERVISFKDDKITGLEQEKEDNRFFSTKNYWKKLFNFKEAENWSIWNWLTWIGLGLVLIGGVVIYIKKRK